MNRRSLDLLPLVDIMMVVLFALVVAQEQDLGSSEAQAAQSATARDSLTREVTQLRTTLANTRAVDMNKLELEAKTQRKAAEELLRKLQVMTKKTVALQQKRWASPRDARYDDVLEKLLDQNPVVEVEVSGRMNEQGDVVNRCCYRAGPRDEAWHACGTVPAVGIARERWLDGGADGLLAQLQDTGGGRAVTIIRQDLGATFAVGGELAQTVRERFPDHRIYTDGVQPLLVSCERK